MFHAVFLTFNIISLFIILFIHYKTIHTLRRRKTTIFACPNMTTSVSHLLFLLMSDSYRMLDLKYHNARYNNMVH